MFSEPDKKFIPLQQVLPKPEELKEEDESWFQIAYYDPATKKHMMLAKVCGQTYLTFSGPAAGSLMSELSITAFHLEDYARCIAHVDQAKKLPGFESSPYKKAVLNNLTLCSNATKQPKKKADAKWLLGDPKKRPGLESPEFDELLASTVPSFSLSEATFDARARSWSPTVMLKGNTAGLSHQNLRDWV